jgi:hypothetical protein
LTYINSVKQRFSSEWFNLRFTIDFERKPDSIDKTLASIHSVKRKISEPLCRLLFKLVSLKQMVLKYFKRGKHNVDKMIVPIRDMKHKISEQLPRLIFKLVSLKQKIINFLKKRKTNVGLNNCAGRIKRKSRFPRTLPIICLTLVIGALLRMWTYRDITIRTFNALKSNNVSDTDPIKHEGVITKAMAIFHGRGVLLPFLNFFGVVLPLTTHSGWALLLTLFCGNPLPHIISIVGLLLKRRDGFAVYELHQKLAQSQGGFNDIGMPNTLITADVRPLLASASFHPAATTAVQSALTRVMLEPSTSTVQLMIENINNNVVSGLRGAVESENFTNAARKAFKRDPEWRFLRKSVALEILAAINKIYPEFVIDFGSNDYEQLLSIETIADLLYRKTDYHIDPQRYSMPDDKLYSYDEVEDWLNSKMAPFEYEHKYAIHNYVFLEHLRDWDRKYGTHFANDFSITGVTEARNWERTWKYEQFQRQAAEDLEESIGDMGLKPDIKDTFFIPKPRDLGPERKLVPNSIHPDITTAYNTAISAATKNVMSSMRDLEYNRLKDLFITNCSAHVVTYCTALYSRGTAEYHYAKAVAEGLQRKAKPPSK